MNDDSLRNDVLSYKTSNEPIDALRAPVTFAKGVGPYRAEVLARLGIFRAFDLLFYFPRDYLEISFKVDPYKLTSDEIQSIAGEIVDFRTFYSRNGVAITKLHVSVVTEIIEAVWFNQRYVSERFRIGARVLLTGAPKKNGAFWQFSHPNLTFLDDGDSPEDIDDSVPSVLPIYHLTEGITQYKLRSIVKNALATLPDLLQEALPQELLEKRGLLSISDAIRKTHFPESLDEARLARRRFAYQEFLVLQLALSICRARRRVNMRAPVFTKTAKIDSRIRTLFPFELTDSQNAAIAEIAEDMSRPFPMNRLLQGDVGSGKTVVAIYAALVAVANGAQVVLMAPTEVLARQHMQTLTRFLRNSATRVVPFFGGQKASERASILREIREGNAQIVVGTQALVYNEIEFKRLGLVIIDEQHKFGVRQRASLKSSTDLEPHYLVMTATPIPRSVTMTLFGDLDVSTMRHSPPGRCKTTTALLTSENRASWWSFVRERLDEGRQAYVVVSRVDGGKEVEEYDPFEGREIRKIENDGSYSKDLDFWNSWAGPAKERADLQKTNGDESTDKDDVEDESSLKSVWTVYKELSEGELKGYRLGVVHGRMTTAEKEAKMLDFRSGVIQVLVATSVVEVGVDVPNATVMTIENADRFGLAQLHQLRGRVGRGKYPGFCAVALSEIRSSEDESKEGKKVFDVKRSKKGAKKDVDKTTAEGKRRLEATRRLEFFTQTTDGFELAEKDFETRGPGELFGARQHGTAAMRVADLKRDRDALEQASEDAREIIAKDPGLAESRHAALRKQVLTRYGRSLDLGDVG